MKNISRLPAIASLFAGSLAVLAVSLLIFNLLMKPPAAELGLMTIFLLITASISGLVGFIAYRLGWMNNAPTLRWNLLAGYAIASILTFFNVWLTARLMFASPHDLMLAVVLLIFAGGMAMLLGFFFSSALVHRISAVEAAARRLAGGDLGVRAPVSGSDEVAQLANSFNEMARQLEEANTRQLQSERHRSDLLAWVGHDLQTPLASTRAILEALSDHVVEDPEVIQRYLKTAQRDVRLLSLLIDDLFQLAQIDAGGLKLDVSPNSLGDLISDTLESFGEQANRLAVNLAGSVAPGVDPVNMDAPRIGRVLNNLVANALRHTHPGGSIQVQACRVSGRVEVAITDTGEGIQPEDLEHIFDQFYRGEKSRSRATGGAGLGLAIARGIILAHGGDLRATSTPGQGTRITFTL